MIKKIFISLSLILVIILISGCSLRPYNKPEFVEIGPNETAFVLPMEGDTKDQGKFDSEEFLMENLVAAKRIEIPRRWVKTGWLPWKGHYVDTVRVIKVDRTTVTREWVTDEEKKIAKGIKVESKDSIKFTVGISATAQILGHEDAAKFLYLYSGRTLADVMDTEIRNLFETTYIEVISSKTMGEVRSSKAEIMDTVRKKVESYFKERGITLTNIGYKGDLVYDDEEVQNALSAQFVAEQKKIAQETTNKMLEEKAASELKQAQTKKTAMEELKEMKKLEISEKIAEGLASGKLKLPTTLVIGEEGNILFDIPVQNTTEK